MRILIVFRYLLSMLDLSKGKTGIFHLVSGVSVIRYALVVSVVNVVVAVVVNVVADIDVEESKSFVTTDSLLADCCM